MQEYQAPANRGCGSCSCFVFDPFYLTIPAEHLERMSTAGEIHAVDTLLYGWAFRLERQLHNASVIIASRLAAANSGNRTALITTKSCRCQRRGNLSGLLRRIFLEALQRNHLHPKYLFHWTRESVRNACPWAGAIPSCWKKYRRWIRKSIILQAWPVGLSMEIIQLWNRRER